MTETIDICKIILDTMDKWAGGTFVAIHRIGNLKVGEVAIVVAVSVEHRKEAFEACRYGIDEIKIRVPIWKKEV
jgi:molybdopterin synthase catalytic subunit